MVTYIGAELVWCCRHITMFTYAVYCCCIIKLSSRRIMTHSNLTNRQSYNTVALQHLALDLSLLNLHLFTSQHVSIRQSWLLLSYHFVSDGPG